MPRGPRERSGSGIYHVMLRGINRQTIFESDDDRFRFLATIKEYVDAGKCNFYGYCLMDNLIYLLFQEAESYPPISIDIKSTIKQDNTCLMVFYLYLIHCAIYHFSHLIKYIYTNLIFSSKTRILSKNLVNN